MRDTPRGCSLRKALVAVRGTRGRGPGFRGPPAAWSDNWIYSTNAGTMEQGPNGVGGGNGVLSGLVTAARLVDTGTPPQGELPEPASLGLAGLALAAAAAARRRARQWHRREG
ncbi:MAG: hypothetical protein Fur0014_01620 [Rubrivivax sp.]